MKQHPFFTAAFALFAIAFLPSCKKDSASPMPFVYYTLNIQGNTVSFTNESTGAATYQWDFGDGTTSTEESPMHTYAAKGKYVPTLFATSSSGMKAEASTVLHIAKSTAVKLTDNTLSDWDTVTHNVVIAGAKSGNFIRAKYDYDANYVYVYFEQTTTQAAGNIYDLYLDADNNITTGLLTGDIKNGAYEVLLEGSVLSGWLDPYYFAGTDQSAFNYASAGINEFYKVGTIQQDGNVQKFEFAISRSKVRGLTGSGLRIGVQVAASDWSATVGYSPDQGGDAFFLDMSE